jgi:hypothetical protein
MANELEQHFLDDWRNKWLNWQKQCNEFLYDACDNPILTTKMILKNKNIGWNMSKIVMNPNVTMHDMFHIYSTHHDCVIDYDDTDNIFYLIGNNPNITINALLHIRDFHDEMNWKVISANEAITIQMMFDNLDLPWDLTGISKNPNVTLEFINNHPNMRWDWSAVLENPNVTFDDAINNPIFTSRFSKDEIINKMSRNPNITMKIILDNIDGNWNWHALGENVGITMQDILKHPDLPWVPASVACNPNLTIDAHVKMKQLHNYCAFYCASFTHDKNNFIARKIKNANITTIHQHYLQYNNPATFDYSTTFKNIERVFLDEYLVKMILEY